MEITKEHLSLLKEKLPEKRFNHSLNVAAKAKELALRYGADPEKAYFAGVFHDIMKYEENEKQLKYIESSGIILSRSQKKCPNVYHAPASAVFVRDELGERDEEIFDAIFYHTTGKENMPLLTKIVYLADMISDDRCYKEVPILRELSEKDLDEAVYSALFMSIEYIKEKKGYLCEDTEKAFEYLKRRR
jgi:nicotinate-nucleotide adenylyltransferase